jgi:hypothetical protein
VPEPQVRIELTTARLRIGCSTPELLWQVWVLPYSYSRMGRLPSHRTALKRGMPWSGLEPLCLSAPPPQDGVSTNFTTRAKLQLIAGSQRRVAAACYLLSAASCSFTGPTGLEPATSRVTVECSNQTELRPQLLESGSKTPSSIHTFHRTGCQSIRSSLSHVPLTAFRHSPKGNRTPLCTVKGCRPNR